METKFTRKLNDLEAAVSNFRGALTLQPSFPGDYCSVRLVLYSRNITAKSMNLLGWQARCNMRNVVRMMGQVYRKALRKVYAGGGDTYAETYHHWK